jgi:hypothetical protein
MSRTALFPNTIYHRSDKTNERESFLFILSLANASVLEIDSAIETLSLDATIQKANSSTAEVTCTEADARSLINRLGASYKVARVLGNDLKNALELAELPYQDKFCWTVSGYGCSFEEYVETRHGLHDLLKSNKMGKSKFLEPNLRHSDPLNHNIVRALELKVSDLILRVLPEETAERGMDFIICGGTSDSQRTFAQTIDVSDLSGYDKRDFGRPFQDPRKTLSPRIGRLLVNLSSMARTRTLLDPFCGLGTILQEAIMCGLSVVGVDRDQGVVTKAKSNLEWLKIEYGVGDTIHTNLFAYDARRISRARVPRVQSIASEPILIPILEKNPGVEMAKRLIEKAKEAYVKALREMALVIGDRNDRIALTTPALVDASGKERALDVTAEASDFGLKPYFGTRKVQTEFSYPLRLESQKRRIVNRCLAVFYKS